MNRKSLFGRYSFVWVTGALFLFSLVGHWLFAWFAYVDEQELHGASVEVSQYFIETLRDTLENWQSEFLQLIWQVAGLAFFIYLGSPQSKEGDERKEEKLDAILLALDKTRGKKTIQEIDQRYPRV